MAAVPFCPGFLSEPRMGGVEGWAMMPLPSHLAPVVLSELGWAECRLALLSLWLSEPRISQMGAPWATLWGWGGVGGWGQLGVQPSVKGVGRVSIMWADSMDVWLMRLFMERML